MKRIIFILTLMFILDGCSIIQRSQKTTDYSECLSHYTVSCFSMATNEAAKENIICSSDNDCSPENMTRVCKPGAPSLLKCIGAKYYCGEQGYCQGCDCPIP